MSDDQMDEQWGTDEEAEQENARDDFLEMMRRAAEQAEAERVAERSQEGTYQPHLVDLPGSAMPALWPLLDLSGGTPEETSTRSSSVAYDDPPPPPR